MTQNLREQELLRERLKEIENAAASTDVGGTNRFLDSSAALSQHDDPDN